MFRVLKLLTVPIVALAMWAGPVKADGFYSGPNGTGYFVQTNDQGRAFVSQYSYRGAGTAEWFAAAASANSTNADGQLFQGSGGQVLGGTYRSPLVTYGSRINFTFSTPSAATVAVGSAAPTDITRLTLEAGRPAGAFNTVRTGWYVDPNALGTGWAFEVQGSTIFGAVFTYNADGTATWRIFTGALILNASNATSTFSGQLQSCTTGPVCANAGAITVQFPTNTRAVVTLPTGGTVSLNAYTF